MNEKIKTRVLKEANNMLKTKKTIRELASIYHVSKSTVHKDLKERLVQIDGKLNKKIKVILKNHIGVRHIHGGESTRKKYLRLKKRKRTEVK